MARSDVDAASPGFLEKPLKRRETTASSVIDSLEPAHKSRIGDACGYFVYLCDDERFAKHLKILLGEERRVLRLRNDDDLSHDETQRLRGAIDGLNLAESLLTDPKTLAETRRQMLGLNHEEPQGVADA